MPQTIQIVFTPKTQRPYNDKLVVQVGVESETIELKGIGMEEHKKYLQPFSSQLMPEYISELHPQYKNFINEFFKFIEQKNGNSFFENNEENWSLYNNIMNVFLFNDNATIPIEHLKLFENMFNDYAKTFDFANLIINLNDEKLRKLGLNANLIGRLKCTWKAYNFYIAAVNEYFTYGTKKNVTILAYYTTYDGTDNPNNYASLNDDEIILSELPIYNLNTDNTDIEQDSNIIADPNAYKGKTPFHYQILSKSSLMSNGTFLNNLMNNCNPAGFLAEYLYVPPEIGNALCFIGGITFPKTILNLNTVDPFIPVLPDNSAIYYRYNADKSTRLYTTEDSDYYYHVFNDVDTLSNEREGVVVKIDKTTLEYTLSERYVITSSNYETIEFSKIIVSDSYLYVFGGYWRPSTNEFGNMILKINKSDLSLVDNATSSSVTGLDYNLRCSTHDGTYFRSFCTAFSTVPTVANYFRTDSDLNLQSARRQAIYIDTQECIFYDCKYDSDSTRTYVVGYELASGSVRRGFVGYLVSDTLTAGRCLGNGTTRTELTCLETDTTNVYCGGFTNEEGTIGLSGVLIKYNKDLSSVIWKKYYSNDGMVSNRVVFKSIKIINDYLYVIGYIDATQYKGLILKINMSDGAVVASKEYIGSDYDILMNMEKTSDNKMLISTITDSITETSALSDTGLIILDETIVDDYYASVPGEFIINDIDIDVYSSSLTEQVGNILDTNIASSLSNVNFSTNNINPIENKYVFENQRRTEAMYYNISGRNMTNITNIISDGDYYYLLSNDATTNQVNLKKINKNNLKVEISYNYYFGVFQLGISYDMTIVNDRIYIAGSFLSSGSYYPALLRVSKNNIDSYQVVSSTIGNSSTLNMYRTLCVDGSGFTHTFGYNTTSTNCNAKYSNDTRLTLRKQIIYNTTQETVYTKARYDSNTDRIYFSGYENGVSTNGIIGYKDPTSDLIVAAKYCTGGAGGFTVFQDIAIDTNGVTVIGHTTEDGIGTYNGVAIRFTLDLSAVLWKKTYNLTYSDSYVYPYSCVLKDNDLYIGGYVVEGSGNLILNGMICKVDNTTGIMSESIRYSGGTFNLTLNLIDDGDNIVATTKNIGVGANADIGIIKFDYDLKQMISIPQNYIMSDVSIETVNSALTIANPTIIDTLDGITGVGAAAFSKTATTDTETKYDFIVNENNYIFTYGDLTETTWTENSIVLDSHLYLCGYTNESDGTNDLMLIKLDTDYNTIATKRISLGGGSDVLRRMTTNGTNLFVAGFGTSPGINQDMFVYEFDANLNIVNSVCYNHNTSDYLMSSAHDGTDLYVVGTDTEDQILIKDPFGTPNKVKNDVLSNAWIYDSVINGNELYVGGHMFYGGNYALYLASYDTATMTKKTFSKINNHASGQDQIFGICTDGSYIYGVGLSTSFGTGNDAIIFKTNNVDFTVSESSPFTVNRLYGTGSEFLFECMYDSGYIYAVGRTDSEGTGNVAGLVAKFDTNLNLIWQKILTNDDATSEIQFKGINKIGDNLYVSGSTTAGRSGVYGTISIKIDDSATSTFTDSFYHLNISTLTYTTTSSWSAINPSESQSTPSTSTISLSETEDTLQGTSKIAGYIKYS